MLHTSKLQQFGGDGDGTEDWIALGHLCLAGHRGRRRNRHLLHTMEILNGANLYFLVPRLVLEEFTLNKER